MRKQTTSVLKSLTVGILTIAAAGCGAKVGTGTYSVVAAGSQYMQACSSVQLSLNDSSNSITASGSASNSGITCTETLNGTENNNVITVSSLTMTLSNGISCIYTGTLNESGSTFSGTLISNNNTSTYNNYASSYCTSITVTGTKTN